MTEKPQKLLYIFDHSDWRSRMPIANAAQDKGYDVTIGIVGTLDDTSALVGFKTIFLHKPAGKMTPAGALKTIAALRGAIREIEPDMIHTVTLKYAFLLGLAAFGTHAGKLIYTLAGLGFLFRSEGIKPKAMRIMLSPLFFLIFRSAKARIIFQNPDDLTLFTTLHYARAEQCHLVVSSGVDLDKFQPIKKKGSQDKPLKVLMPTRLVREKGIQIFVDAARYLKAKGMEGDFEIAGGETMHNPGAISKKEMLEMTRDGAAHWLGRVEDMPALLAEADIVVYPSYYGEGVPRVLIEAAACGKPIVTTDHPGCREAVNHGENGFLVPVKDMEATAHTIEKLIKNDKLRHQMEKNSRKLAETTFDVKIVVKKTLAVYKIL